MKKTNLKRPIVIYSLTSFVVCIILWMPLRSTFILLNEYFQLTSQLQKITIGRVVERKIDKELEAMLLLDTDYQKDVFDMFSLSCQAQDVNVRLVEPAWSQSMDNVNVQSQQIVVEGDFISILKSLHNIQDDLRPVKISSVLFAKAEHDKHDILTAKIVFQSLEKLPNDHEQ